MCPVPGEWTIKPKVPGPIVLRDASEATLVPPYQALPPISVRLRAALEKEALRLNDRYLHEFIEEYAFCPFARAGRQAGQTSRYFFYADTLSVEPILEIMRKVAADPQQVVAQVIMPLIDVAPEAWIRFVNDVTALGHARMGGPPALAFAALHPALAYNDRNPFALVPLFRRAPDPTIQWARLDALAGLYAGRDSVDRYLDEDDVGSFMHAASPPRPALYDRVTETNAKMAHHMSLAKVEAMVTSFADDARRSYQRLLLEDEHPAAGACPAEEGPTCASR